MILVFLSACKNDNPDGPKVNYDKGIRYYNNGEYQKAILCFGKALSSRPIYIHAYFYRGISNIQLKNYQKGIKDLNISVELERDYLSYYWRGKAWLGNGSYNLAIEDLNESISLRSDYAWSYNLRAITYEHKGKYDLALNDFNQSILITGNSSRIPLYNKGVHYYKKQDYDKAIENFNLSLEIEPYYKTHYLRGLSYYFLKNYNKAIDDFTKSINNKPEYYGSYYFRGRSCYIQKKYNLSISDFKKTLKLKFNFTIIHTWIGDSYVALGNSTMACENYQNGCNVNVSSSCNRLLKFCN